MTRFLSFLCLIFGHISWAPPPWMKKCLISRKAAALVALGSLGVIFSHYWQLSSQGELITAEIAPPEISENLPEIIPKPLKLYFGVKESYLSSRSVAPLGGIGRTVVSGIKMDPPIKGVWRWENESALTFLPAGDWPAGQSYNITFDKNIFADFVNMKSYKYQFSTKPFKIDKVELKLYQDPRNPDLRKIVGTLEFNFPVESASLEKCCRLFGDNQYPLKVSYDKHRRRAYIESDLVELTIEPRYLHLRIVPWRYN